MGKLGSNFILLSQLSIESFVGPTVPTVESNQLLKDKKKHTDDIILYLLTKSMRNIIRYAPDFN